MLPEQVWDADDIPTRELRNGRATGSVAPLGWAHGEYLKLLVALASSRRTDIVAPAARRYSASAPATPPFVWHAKHQFQTFPSGRRVSVQVDEPGLVRWTADQWASYKEVPLQDTTLGLWVATLPTDIMRPGATMEWTTHHDGTWEGANHVVRCVEAES
jgi:glucoamylase